MNDVRYTEITAEEEGQRLDNYLIRVLKGVPKSHIYRIIRGGEVRVNKKRAKVSSRLCQGDRVRIPPVRTSQDKDIYVGARLEQRLLESVLYEDESILVVNKPAGIAVHGGSGLSLGVIEAMRKVRTDLHYLELIHRLDKDTSGCLLMAKKRSALRSIQALLAERAVTKTYWALLSKPWQGKKTVIIDVPLEKNTLKSGERMVVVSDVGKASETAFKLLENYQDTCWVEASPKTGRTHQIRVHSAYFGHPIIGDQKYGVGALINGIDATTLRLYLHARAIQFTLNGKTHTFQAELDDKFVKTLEHVRNNAYN